MQDKITIADAPDCLNTNDKAMWVLGYQAALAARSTCLHQIQEPEADIWPCINIDVDASGKITNAKLYSPGLPAGNHDVYPVRVPYMDEHTEAWRACVDELEKAVPGFMSLGNMNGIECAVAAIRGLSERAKHQEPAAAEQAAWHAGLDEGRAQASLPVVVPDDMPSTEANTKYGESYGVDWVYEGKTAAPAAVAVPERWCPDVCPITGRRFFGWIEHWKTGKDVPTYGGPFDSYTIPVKDEDGTFSCERFDHDAGEWMTEGMGWCDLGLMLTDDQTFVVKPNNPRYDEIRDFAEGRAALAATPAAEVMKFHTYPEAEKSLAVLEDGQRVDIGMEAAAAAAPVVLPEPDDYKQEIGSKNCMQCSVAYLLGLPLHMVPDFAAQETTQQSWELFESFIASQGYAAVMLTGIHEFETDYLASGTSPRGIPHMVVMNDGNLVHDPHPSNAGLSDVQCIWLITRRALLATATGLPAQACIATLTVDSSGNLDYETAQAGWLLPEGVHQLYAAPQAQADARDADVMYYLQDARWSAMVGNCPSFWRSGGGYTTSLDDAERFTLEAAMKQHKCRETDLPWLCSELDKLRRPTVDCQYMPRSWDAQRAAIAAQSAAKEGSQG